MNPSSIIRVAIEFPYEIKLNYMRRLSSRYFPRKTNIYLIRCIFANLAKSIPQHMKKFITIIIILIIDNTV